MGKTKARMTISVARPLSHGCPMAFSAPPSFNPLTGLGLRPTQEQKFPSIKLNQIYKCTIPEQVYAKWRYVQVIGVDETTNQIAYAPYSIRTCTRTSNFDYQGGRDFLSMYTLNISNTMKSINRAQDDKAKRKTKRTK